FIERLDDVLADRTRVRHDAIALLAKRTRDLHQHAVKAGPAVGVVVGREIRAAEKHLPIRREERGERPATLTAERLHSPLIARIHVGPLVAVHLDADEIAIEDLRDLRILVRLAVHHVAPMTPHGAYIQQDRLLLLARSRERRIPPRQPVYWL